MFFERLFMSGMFAMSCAFQVVLGIKCFVVGRYSLDEWCWALEDIASAPQERHKSEAHSLN